MENSIYHSRIIYNNLKQLNLCRIYSQTYIKHILAIILSVFTIGFKGKTVNFEQSSPCHRTTIAYFLNYGKLDDSKLEDILKQSVIDIIYHEAEVTGKPVFCIVDDTISSHTKYKIKTERWTIIMKDIEQTLSHENLLTEKIARQVLFSLGHLTLKEALRLIAYGEEKAESIHVPMVLTVVDEGGNIVAQHRMDDALLASISISYAKAYTAPALKTATSDAAKSILPGQSLYGLQETHPGKFCLFGGGISVFRNEHCIGGLGVSGGTVEQDTMVAEYAIKMADINPA